MATENAELLKRLDPAVYFEQFLAEGIYPDGRQLRQFRHTAIECGGPSAGHQGSAHVHQGGAYVSCTVQLSLAPDSDDPLIQWEMEAMENVPKDLLEHAKAHLQAIFASNQLVRPEALQITTTGKSQQQQQQNAALTRFQLRWTLHLKITVLSWDGFLLDAILTAVQAAMLDTRVPTHVEYNVPGGATSMANTIFAEDDADLLGEEVPLLFDIEKLKILDPQRESEPLQLAQHLVYVPILLYNKNANSINGAPRTRTDEDERLLICDPTAELCKLYQHERCELIMGPGGRINSLTCCLASGQLEQPLLKEVLELAQQRYTAVSSALNKCVREKEKEVTVLLEKMIE